MRRGPLWMTKSDDAILEVLDYTDAALSLKAITVNCNRMNRGISYTTSKRRVPKLVEAGLVEPIEENERFYVITENGRKYLQGEHTPADLDEDKE